MLRVLAGTIGINVAITVWLIITATLLSLLIALCKRYLEIRLCSAIVRPVLKKYNATTLQTLITLAALLVVIFYCAYVFNVHTHSFGFMLTIPCVMLGIWRFIKLTYHYTSKPIDDPVLLFSVDRFSCINLFIFFILTASALW